MKIVLVIAHFEDHPDVPTLRGLLIDIEHVELIAKPVGNISFLPCIAALDDAGFARQSGGIELSLETVQAWAAEDGTPLAAVDPTRGRDLTWDEFLDVARATDAAAARQILLQMPDVAEYGRKYIYNAGIVFADAGTPAEGAPVPRLYGLISDAIGLGLIDTNFVASFLSNWCEKFPLRV